MKLGKDEVNTGNGFKLLWRGIIGLFMLFILFGKWFWHFTLWFGKIFMKFGESYGKHMDKKLKDIDKKY